MEGPVLLRVFSCKDCIHLKNSTLSSLYNTKKPYTCYHNDMIIGQSGLLLMLGNIGSDKITPKFCPFIFKQQRVEKLKLLQSYNEEVKK